jgi:hypothetical protein
MVIEVGSAKATIFMRLKRDVERVTKPAPDFSMRLWSEGEQ